MEMEVGEEQTATFPNSPPPPPYLARADSQEETNSRRRSRSRSRSPSRSPSPGSKRKGTSEHGEDQHHEEEHREPKASRRHGVLTLEGSIEEDRELCQGGDVSLSVRNDLFSRVIGKNGLTIKQACSLTGANVKLDRPTDQEPEGTLRLYGAPNQLVHCISLLRVKICSTEDLDLFRRTLTRCLNFCGPLEVMEFQVSEENIGRLMGKGGSNIRTLQESNNVMINVIKNNNAPDQPSNRDCSIAGHFGNVNKCFLEMMRLISSDREPCTVHAKVSEATVGAVIGKHGQNLTECGRFSGAIVKLARTKIEDLEMRELVLTGFPDQIADAMQFVYDRMNHRSTPRAPRSSQYESSRSHEHDDDRRRDHSSRGADVHRDRDRVHEPSSRGGRDREYRNDTGAEGAGQSSGGDSRRRDRVESLGSDPRRNDAVTGDTEQQQQQQQQQDQQEQEQQPQQQQRWYCMLYQTHSSIPSSSSSLSPPA